MRPVVLKGHSRPLTRVRFNREGDLLFTVAKDSKPTAWWSSTGERIGTYNGHNGAVWDIDLNFDTTRVVTASADNTAKYWNAESGACLFTWEFKSPVRCVALAPSERIVALANAKLMGQESVVRFVKVPEVGGEEGMEHEEVRVVGGSGGGMETTAVRVVFGPTGEWIMTATEDASVTKWDVETGKAVQSIEAAHKLTVTDLQFSADFEQFVTSSKDMSVKLWDTRDMRLLKEYKTDRSINSAAISPIFDHVIVGGGQDAAAVTTTGDREGKFDAKFMHKIYTEEFGRVRGHFGPINTVAVSPSGRQFVTGGEDGYVRLHTLDPDYFTKEYD